MNSGPCIDAIPIRSVAPTSECAKKKVTSKSMKVKKKKPSAKFSHQNGSSKLKSKQPKKSPSHGGKVVRKNPTEVYNAAKFDFSKVPPPVCSCTGVARGCYKCGTCGWQSSCCTTTISQYPLPMSPSKPGARLGGRKMTTGVYTKLLCRLATEGADLSYPVDLKHHWAKHGTNKFVTIK
ncbi:hypothetical protein M9H77_25203 [Catharanthus roseus]|uniref:Uncharacterized protein n=1 Tax=Catharanthus roseus TaxID=4058 RepID=A0ACC0A698_CATRO|nr:hypothetical protein M9H77_25203 [Catharanthus roseus]